MLGILHCVFFHRMELLHSLQIASDCEVKYIVNTDTYNSRLGMAQGLHLPN